MYLQYFGHSVFALEGKEQAIIIDPFISGNPHMKGKTLPESLKFSQIFLTHGHGDHAGDAERLAAGHKAEVVAFSELATIFAQKGHKVMACAMGGKLEFPWGWARLVPATHSSSYEGAYAGLAAGLIINMEGTVIYHAGDTGLFGDMELIGRRYRPDVALLPIGGTFTMDIEEAVEAVKMIGAKTVIPMHYNTFPVVKADPEEFKKLAEAASSSKVRVMQPLERIEF